MDLCRKISGKTHDNQKKKTWKRGTAVKEIKPAAVGIEWKDKEAEKEKKINLGSSVL